MKKLLILLTFISLTYCSSDSEITTPPPVINYTLTVSPGDGGSVSSTGGSYEKGSSVSITAIPGSEYVFVNWSNESTENPLSVTVNSNQTLTANFEKRKYPLTINIEGEGTVTEEIISSGKTTTEYNSGSSIRLTSVPTDGWEFSGWSGSVSGTQNPIELSVDESKNVTAEFMRYYDYNVTSHYYKNEMNPYFDLIEIVQNHGIEGPRYGGYDTGVAYADFNGDGYIDINLLLNPGVDGDFCEHFMLINNGDDTFSIDNTLISNPNFQTYMSRKTIVGDFNGDNKPDVVRIAGGHDWLRKSNILMSGDDHYEFTELDVVPESQYHGFASGDLDNDGDLDLFFGGPDSGFAMNDGSGNFTWFRVDEKISNYFLENTEVIGPYGVQTVEILDVNQDGNLDIVVGGSYADHIGHPHLGGPTILWGDGSSNYDYNNKTEIWGFGERPTMTDGSTVDNNDDFSFADIDNDGYLDMVLVYIRQIDNDPNNNGNTTMSHYYQVMKGNSYTEFTDVTDEWLPDNIKYCTVVWVILKDIDQNGQLDLTEYAKTTYKGGSYPTSSCNEDSWRWEWNGNGFTVIN